MKRANQSHIALLGLLSMGEKSGYDLKQLSSWSVGHFWREGYGQIYPALKAMALAGLVKRRAENTPGRPDRYVYSLTAAGKKEMNQWLLRSVVDEVPRNEFLLKLFFGAEAPVSVSREHIAEHRRRCQARLQAYAAVKKRLKKECAGDPRMPFWLMTLRYGQVMAQAATQWCDSTLAALGEDAEARKKSRTEVTYA